MSLPRPIKSVLEPAPVDAPVSRGWVRIQRKRRVRDTARKSVLAVCCLALAGSVGWALRPLFPGRAPLPLPTTAVARMQPLETLVQQLPKVRARSPQVQRPMPPPQAPAVEEVQPLPEDIVAALLESVRDAFDSGNVARAAALLQEIADKHEEDPRAAQAMYVLGLIQLERNHDAAGATASFTHALELQPPPELVPTLWQALERARATK